MNVPNSISLLFILICLTTVFVFYISSLKNNKALLVISTIMILQGALAFFNFYSSELLAPWKVPMVVAPSFITMFYILFSQRGRNFINSLDISKLTLLHTIRIPVEIVLFLLFMQRALPEAMTFEGRNFDILAGITAPIVYYLAFVKKIIGPKGLLIWNILSLLLLINIIVVAVLSIELPFQQFGLDQPNRAILYFPFVWLPSVVVPIVFFSHLATIKRIQQGL